MLQAIRERAQGLFAWVILLAIIVPFALWGIQNYFDDAKESPVVTVNGSDIFDAQVNDAYQRSLAALIGVSLDESELKKQALDQLIKERLTLSHLSDLELSISDQEVASNVTALPYFNVNGKFDLDKYKATLGAQGMTSSQFAGEIRSTILREQLSESVLSSEFSTESELSNYFKRKSETRSAEFSIIAPESSVVGSPSSSDVNSYYQAHRANFAEPKQVSIQFVELSLAGNLGQSEPSELELKALYDEQKANFKTPERRRVAHILIDRRDSAGQFDESLALADAQSALKEIEGGANFETVAKRLSSDPLSAKIGGDLGIVERGIVSPSFSEAAFALTEGAVSKPVRTDYGYHLIKVLKVEPESTKSFDQVRDDIKSNYLKSEAESTFYDKVHRLQELSFEHPDSLVRINQELGLEIRKSDFFSVERGEGIAELDVVRKAAFSDDVQAGKNSDPLELSPDRVIVLRIEDIKEPRERTLGEVSDQIVAILKKERMQMAARSKAEEMLQLLSQGLSFTDAARRFGVAVDRRDSVSRTSDSLPERIRDAMFAASSHTYVGGKQIVTLDEGKFAVVSFLGISESVLDPKIMGQPDSVEAKEYLSAKQSNALSAVIEQLRADAKISYHKELAPEAQPARDD